PRDQLQDLLPARLSVTGEEVRPGGHGRVGLHEPPAKLCAVRFAPHTDGDVREMLSAIGLGSVDGLFAQIPPSVRLDRELAIPEGVSEMELVADLRELASRNRHADDLVCFAGAGAYDHYVPSVVWALAG